MLVIRTDQMESLEQARRREVVRRMIRYGRQHFPEAKRFGSLARAALGYARVRGYDDRALDLYYALCLAAGRDIISQGPAWMNAILDDARFGDPSARVARLHAEAVIRLRRRAETMRARAAFSFDAGESHAGA